MGCTISIRIFFFLRLWTVQSRQVNLNRLRVRWLKWCLTRLLSFTMVHKTPKQRPHFPRYVSHSSHTIHPSVHPHKQANICSSSVPLPTYHIPSCCTPVTSTTRACRLHSLSTTSCPQPTMPISPPDASFPIYPSPSPKLGGL